ncbi:MAG: flagellin [Anaerolineae bacterium]|nr:flagellin [Anaerolineae bacterium]
MPTVDLTRIGSNIGAMYSLQSLLDINNKLATTQQRLSTGKRINSAADDPAGLVIATKMNARSVGLKVVQDNISDATNMMSVAESGLNQLTDIVTQMRSKATQAANDTLGATERAAIQTQLEQYAEQIDDILAETKWNGVQLLSGSLSKQFQTGVDISETTTWTMNTNLTSGSAGLDLSDSYTTNGFSNANYSASLTAVATSTVGTNQIELATGGYSFEILGKAGGAAQGAVTATSSLLGGTTSITASAANTGSGLASGTYTLRIDAVASSTNINYSLINASGNTVATVTNFDANNSAGQLFWASGASNDMGVTLGFSSDASGLSVGSQMTFEFINQGQVKLEMNDASGQAVSIDQDGSGAGTTYGSYAYANAGGAYVSGRGMSTTIAALGTTVVGQTASFDYHKQGSYVVDVSTASKAATYMDKANSALDTINNQLATLGSLMARMNIKATAASSAQINVEAAYNRIMNANMAEEQVNASKYQVLQQTAVAMLAQSNRAPQAILSLFQ